MVIQDLVDGALRELADEAQQAQVWTASTGPEVSSFDECVCRLFDDSGLGDEMARGPVVYTPDIDEHLAELLRVVGSVDGTQAPEALLRDPGVARARLLASSILQRLNDVRYEPS